MAEVSEAEVLAEAEPAEAGNKKEEKMRFKFWQKNVLKPENVFTKEELDKIAQATKKAESLTSGEIRVVIRGACKSGLTTKQQALADFREYGLVQTRDKTGVLILVVLQKRRVEVLADKGINDIVPAGYWDGIVWTITNSFRNIGPCKGICEAVETVGQMLAEKFPRKPDDTNELPNEPIVH